MAEDGWCPFVEIHKTPNFGYNPPGTHGQLWAHGLADHIAQGPKSAIDSAVDAGWGWVLVAPNTPAVASAHFCIGRDGSASQYCSILDAAWAQGIYDDPGIDRTNAVLAAALSRAVTIAPTGSQLYALDAAGVNVLNGALISFEHEGTSGQAWTDAELATDIRVKLWCLGELQRLGRGFPLDSIDRLLGHFMIDPVNRAGCPGPHWPRQSIWTWLTAQPQPSPAPSPDPLQAQVDQLTAANKLLTVQLAAANGQRDSLEAELRVLEFNNALIVELAQNRDQDAYQALKKVEQQLGGAGGAPALTAGPPPAGGPA